MLAELAAANAAFAVIKQCVSNGRDLASAGKAIGDFVFAKEELTRRAKNRKKPGQANADLEEFMALEKINEQEQHLKEVMIWSGRPGMWDDWVKFQAQAARRRREAKEAAAREAIKRQERAARLTEYIVMGMASVILAGLIIYGIVLYMLHLR